VKILRPDFQMIVGSFEKDGNGAATIRTLQSISTQPVKKTFLKIEKIGTASKTVLLIMQTITD